MHGKIGRGRRRLVCYHEAGHAVVRWWLGHGAENAVVISPAAYLAGAAIPDRCGVLHRAEGIVFGYNISDPATYKLNLATTVASEPRLLKRYSERIAMDLMMTFAGAVAEGRYRRSSLAGCLIAGGSGDMEHMKRISETWYDHKAEATAAIVEAERIARAFVRAPKAWAAIGVVAQALLQRGELDGVVIASLCTAAYGAAPEYDAWALRWPPTPEEIQSGFIPPGARDEQHVRRDAIGSGY